MIPPVWKPRGEKTLGGLIGSVSGVLTWTQTDRICIFALPPTLSLIITFQSTSWRLSFLFCKIEILTVPTCGPLRDRVRWHPVMTIPDDHRTSTSVPSLASHSYYHIFVLKRQVRLREVRWFSQGHTAGGLPVCTYSALPHRSCLSTLIETWLILRSSKCCWIGLYWMYVVDWESHLKNVFVLGNYRTKACSL